MYLPAAELKTLVLEPDGPPPDIPVRGFDMYGPVAAFTAAAPAPIP